MALGEEGNNEETGKREIGKRRGREEENGEGRGEESYKGE